MDGAGFGIDRPAELSKEDDEYEAFRKRMMLAYRFRPNPLVRMPGWAAFAQLTGEGGGRKRRFPSFPSPARLGLTSKPPPVPQACPATSRVRAQLPPEGSGQEELLSLALIPSSCFAFRRTTLDGLTTECSGNTYFLNDQPSLDCGMFRPAFLPTPPVVTSAVPCNKVPVLIHRRCLVLLQEAPPVSSGTRLGTEYKMLSRGSPSWPVESPSLLSLGCTGGEEGRKLFSA